MEARLTKVSVSSPDAENNEMQTLLQVLLGINCPTSVHWTLEMPPVVTMLQATAFNCATTHLPVDGSSCCGSLLCGCSRTLTEELLHEE